VQAHKLTTYESWSLAIPEIPLRSHLYHLEPIGVGTPLVESLTGYVTRLASVHCLPTGILVLSKIAPHIKEEYVFRIKAGLTKIDSINAINGNRSTATNWVLALETLTLCSNLHFLTMLTWADVLSTQGLLRGFRAWCPACYQEWRAVGQAIYEPLIWALNVVKVCPLHYQCLQIRCPNCHKKLPKLAWSSRPGYCSSCKGWLGLTLEAKVSNSEFLSENELKWQLWVLSNIKELIAIASLLSSPPTRTTIQKVISAYVNQVFKGNVKALASLLEMDRETVNSWYNNTSIPTLESCLKISNCFGISVADFLTKEDVFISASPAAQLQAKEKHSQRKTPEKFNHERVRSTLEAALNEYPPPSLQEIVRRL
jgi:DNA-binding XRE family transcriptional regulator